VGVAVSAPGAAAAAHVACGQVVTEDTSFDSDLACFGSGVTVGAAGIVIDLRGHTISGTSGAGVWNQAHADVTVQNGRVEGFTRGILLLAPRNTVRKIVAARNEADGILVQSDGGLVERNVAVDNHDRFFTGGHGLFAGGDGARVIGNTAVGNYTGIVAGGNRSLVEQNVAIDNISPTNRLGMGLSLSGVDSVFRKNVAMGNGECGIRAGGRGNRLTDNTTSGNIGSTLTFHTLGQELCLFDFDAGVVERNTATETGGGRLEGCAGIYLQDSDQNRVEHNVASDNDFNGLGSGICLVRSIGNQLIKNHVSGNGDDGISIRFGSTDTLLHHNVTSGNGEDGIDVEIGSGTLSRNTADGNGDLGIEAQSGVVDAGGNKASGNGNPMQCENVICK
jgi:large repetitive protein